MIYYVQYYCICWKIYGSAIDFYNSLPLKSSGSKKIQTHESRAIQMNKEFFFFLILSLYEKNHKLSSQVLKLRWEIENTTISEDGIQLKSHANIFHRFPSLKSVNEFNQVNQQADIASGTDHHCSPSIIHPNLTPLP